MARRITATRKAWYELTPDALAVGPHEKTETPAGSVRVSGGQLGTESGLAWVTRQLFKSRSPDRKRPP